MDIISVNREPGSNGGLNSLEGNPSAPRDIPQKGANSFPSSSDKFVDMDETLEMESIMVSPTPSVKSRRNRAANANLSFEERAFLSLDSVHSSAASASDRFNESDNSLQDSFASFDGTEDDDDEVYSEQRKSMAAQISEQPRRESLLSNSKSQSYRHMRPQSFRGTLDLIDE
jgi:hypothetical protein